MPRKVFIYALADPRVKHPIRRFFYVGKTGRAPELRLATHLKAARERRGWLESPSCIRWIRSLSSSGVTPTVHILEKVSLSHWQEAEMRHIARLRWLGAPLVNQTLGGAGVRGLKFKESSREKMRLAKLGKKPSTATRRKMSAAGLRTWKDPTIRASRILPRIGHTYSKATLRKMSLAAKGRVIPPKQRRKISRSLTGKKQSPETRLKRRIALKRAWSNPELRKAHSAIILKRSKNPQYRRKLSKAARLAWARRKKKQT